MGNINVYNKEGYLDWPKIFKLTARTPIIFLTGSRGCGKSYGLLKELWHSGECFMYLRRTQKEADISCRQESNPFNSLIADKAVPEIVVKSVAKDLSAFYEAKPDDEGRYVASGNYRGLVGALSTFSSMRGMDFSSVRSIFYDEFCPEKTARPIKGEATALWNLYETICRNRELKGEPPVKLIACANSNDITNPYYLDLGIVDRAVKMQQEKQTISIDESRGLSLIYLDHSPISSRKKHTTLYKLTSNSSQFSSMALENRFWLQDSEVIKPYKLPGEWTPLCGINGIVIYKHKNERLFYISTYKTGTYREFGSSYAEKKRFLNNYLSIWTAHLRSRVYFESYACLELFEQAYDPTVYN